MAERVPHIRRARQGELYIAGAETGFAIQGAGGDGVAHIVGQEVGGLGLEGVEGRHDKPYLIEPERREQVARQGDVSAVDGVERTAEDAYLSGGEGHGNEGEGMGCGAIGSQNRSRADRPPPWHAPSRH